MKTIIFSYYRGRNDKIKEEFEYEDDVEEKDINYDYEQWVWGIIGDRCTWYEKDSEEDKR